MNIRFKLWYWWSWIKWTPVVVVLFLITLRFVAPKTFDDSNTIGEIWLFVALGSLCFVTLIRTRTKRMVRLAESDLQKALNKESGEDGREVREAVIHARNLHTNTTGYVIIHALFLLLGIVSVMPSISEETKDFVGITALLTGQYMLFLIAMRSYLAIVMAWKSHDTRQYHYDERSKV